MRKIEFGGHELTALVIRDPMIEASAEAAKNFELFVNFYQRQQAAFGPWPARGNRERIGNGKHKSWSLRFQREPLGHNHPLLVAEIMVRSAVDPEKQEFGGFDYGTYDEAAPTYRFITLHKPSEMGVTWLPKDPTPDLEAAVGDAVENALTVGQKPLF